MSGTPELEREFLHQYMTLIACDLFFADKAVLIEGCAERLLFPKLVEMIDREAATQLGNQYVSLVEVCGGHAHRFFDLLAFLELRTLIITDIDSVVKNANSKWVKCLVAEGVRTSNGCLKKWFDDPAISPEVLLSKTAEEKTVGGIRVTYQVPETDGGPCGRSFEDAFILANAERFTITDVSGAEKAKAAWDLAANENKTEFALRHAIQETGWKIPRYIVEGLKWLAAEVTTAPTVADITSGEPVLPPPAQNV